MPELNLDGIVGPTHNYAGLSLGNIASSANQGATSRPRHAARQGLAKLAALAELGVPQGYLPPQERPHLPTLRRLGFEGRDEQILERVARDEPSLLAAVSSASSMWTANAATVTPSCDAHDGRVHFLTANLRSMFHRSIEPPATRRALRAAFADERRFVVHEALPSTGPFGDEGAANHTRLTATRGAGGEHPGVHLFVFGAASEPGRPAPLRFPARQDERASRAVARAHGIESSRLVFAQQNPQAIDLGVFHNDVIAVGNGSLLLIHERALVDQAKTLDALRQRIGAPLVVVTVRREELSVEEAVATYLFNSQIVTLPDGSMLLVAPNESREHARAGAVIDRVVGDAANPISRAVHFDLRESMRNGGGPACLRLRVPLTDDELAAMNRRMRYAPTQHQALESWVDRHYPETLSPAELADPQLLRRSRDALDELTRLLELGPIYDFQRA